MVPVARRNLLADKAKLLVALGGVTLAILLILVVQSLYQGVKREYASFINALPGDAWVAQQGVSGVVFTSPFLTDSNAADVARIKGVTAVHRLYGRPVSLQADGHEAELYVWAVAPGGTLTPQEARMIPEPGAIFIDRSSAGRLAVSSGDVLRHNGTELTVAEVGRVGNVLLAEFAFIHPQDYSRLFGSLGPAKFFMVALGPDATQATSQAITQRIEGSAVYTREEFVAVAQEPVGDFLAIVRVIMIISFIVGLAVLSLIIYSATIERAREYAIMKVLGASPLRLYRIVISQSTFIAVLGFAAGVGLAFLFNRLAADLVPEFITYIRWRDVALVLGVAAVMTFIASYMPVNRVARVDPASVFRA